MEYRTVAEGIEFAEGPLELPGGDILFTEIRAGRLTRVSPDGTRRETFATTGGGPNGAAIGPDGAIYVTQNGGFAWSEGRTSSGERTILPGPRPDTGYIGGQIQRVSADGAEVTTIHRECEGEPLKGPNDLVFDREGNFYFTDHGKRHGRTQDITGVFYASPSGDFIREIIFPLERPNGIGLSPDERTLYVAETPTGRLWAFDLEAPGKVGARRVVATAPVAPPHQFAMWDSLCVDAEGNVIVATLINGGVTSISPDGARVEHHPLPDRITTNACFAGPALRTLYVTLGSLGKLVAFDGWPTAGLRLNFQAGGG